MGWTGIPQWHGNVEDEVTAGYDHCEPIRTVRTRDAVFAAMLDRRDDSVWGLVVLYEIRDGELLYKSMDEGSGPYHLAPMGIIDLLTPTTNEYASEWRRRCAEAATTKRRRLTFGQVIDLGEELTFTSGTKARCFIFQERYTFRAIDGDKRPYVRLPRDWKTRYSWECVSPDWTIQAPSAA